MKRTCHIKGLAFLQFSDGTDFTLPGSTADRYIYAYSYDSFGRLTESARYAGFSVNPNIIFTEKNLTYDGNGNMTLDALRNIALTYDINNLVSTVSRNDTLLSTYHYFADGTKYKVIDPDNNGRVYIGPFFYTTAKSGNTVYSYLEGIDTDGGRIMIVRKQSGTQNTYDYTTAFFVRDHLGSTRVMVNAQGDILERNAYYPFGLRMNQGKAYPSISMSLSTLYPNMLASTPARRDLYNGKELQMIAQTRLIDYGARQYDPTIARWNGMDPMAEKYYYDSPLIYCSNNPLSIIDKDGNDWYRTNGGKVTWTDYKSQEDLDNNNIVGTYLGEAHIEFKGSRYERLGDNGSIQGKGAINAKATLYGPKNKDDIHVMTGYTMTSDADKYGAIDEGLYLANYDAIGKSGTLKSNWVINHRGEVRMMDGKINPNAPRQINPNTGEGYKTGVFIHATQTGGYARGKTSTACLLLMPKDFEIFNSVMTGVKNFTVQVTRSVLKTLELNGVNGFIKDIHFLYDKTD